MPGRAAPGRTGKKHEQGEEMENLKNEIIDAATAGLIFIDGVQSVDTKTLQGRPDEGRMFTITRKDGRKFHFALRWAQEEEVEALDRLFEEQKRNGR